MSPRFQVIAAIIRKDVQLLWPLALGVALLQLVIASTFHTTMDYPGVYTPPEGAFLHGIVVLTLLGAVLPPFLAAIFIFDVVQTDIATDIRHDWLTRPVGAPEMAIAKIALVLAVVFVPLAIGDTIFMIVNDIPVQQGLVPIFIVLRNCLGAIVLAWLVSSTMQMVMTVLGLVTLSAISMAVIAATAYFVSRAHAGLPPAEGAELAQAMPMLSRVLVQLAFVAAVMWPVLWLLLVRRRKGQARLLFVLAFLINNAIPFAHARMTAAAQDTEAARPAANLPNGETTPE